jgi:RNA-binding protein NOB1
VEGISSALENLPLQDRPQASESNDDAQSSEVSINTQDELEEEPLEPLNVQLQPLQEVGIRHEPAPVPVPSSQSSEPIFDDPSDSDDGEGEWITPSNVGLHKSRALNLLPDAGSREKRKGAEVMHAGCMTADFAMQNVLLQMGLYLVGLEGKRIEKVKSWVLRCHACFK